MRRPLCPRVEHVGASRGEQHGQPADAGAEVSADEVAEERAEGEIATEVVELDVQRECRDGAPPFAAEQRPRFEPAGAEPIAIEDVRVQREEHGQQRDDVPDDAGPALADFLDRPRADLPRVLVPVERELGGRRGRARQRHPELPAADAGLALVRDAPRRENEGELVDSRLRESSRDGYPLLRGISHLC